MRTIDIGIDKIDKIYHIADVHVRNVKRHKEYQFVLTKVIPGGYVLCVSCVSVNTYVKMMKIILPLK